MKVRVCPKCGKHNDESAFSCIDCGTTLSLKTLVDLDSGKFLNVKPIAGYTELADISPYFEEDVEDIIRRTISFGERIVWGCNIAHLAQAGGISPLLPGIMVVSGKALLFGYAIITDQRLITVYFTSDPERSRLEVWTSHNSLKPIFAVGQPGFELSSKEKLSRQVTSHPFSDLASIRMESKGIKDISLASLIIGLKQGQESSITFYGIHDAEKVREILVGNQEKQAR